MANDLRKIVQKYTEQKLEKAKENIKEGIIKTNNILLNEVNKMYKSYIQQFYEYKTTSYIRHGTSRPGTGYGYALYRANRSRTQGGRLPKLRIDISGSYIDEKYEYDTPETVLFHVMLGIRFSQEVFSRKLGYSVPIIYPWDGGSYSGPYFSYNGDIQDAFNSFDKDFDTISRRIFNEVFKPYGWL